MRFHWSCAMWVVLLSLRASAATDISVGSDIGVTGNQVTIPVTLSSDVSIVGLQLDVNFDATKLTFAAVQKGAALEADHVVQSNELSSGQLRLLLYSSQNTAIASGDILQLSFGVPEGAPLGPVTVSLSGVLLADPSATAVSADSTDSGVVTVTDTPPAVVQGRMLFYNNSSFDTSSDADAIATDKVALLPGGVASFANYSSYSRGINGIMIDVANLAQPGNIDASDFTFKVGNTDDPSTWSLAEAPLSIGVEEGGGGNGSDRITIIWADNVVQKQWLEVSLLANADTGLSGPDVFYFGNAIGDTGDAANNTQVDLIDQNGVRGNRRNFLDPAPIDFAYDFDRDRFVDLIDQNIARGNRTNFLTALRLLNLSTQQGSAIVTLSVDREVLASYQESSETLSFAHSLRLNIRRSDNSDELIIELMGDSEEDVTLLSKSTLSDDWDFAESSGEAQRLATERPSWRVPVFSKSGVYRLIRPDNSPTLHSPATKN